MSNATVHPAFTGILGAMSGDTIREAFLKSFNDDDWYQLDASDHIVRSFSGQRFRRCTVTGQIFPEPELPAGHRLLRGLAAKYEAVQS